MVNKVLVGGGTGFIGRHLAPLLTASGYEVTCVSRMPAPTHMSWQQLAAAGLPPRTRAVVNLAGQNIMDFTRRWTPGFKQNVENSRINTTRALATAINKSKEKPRVLVLVSGVGAYEPSESATYHEGSGCRGNDYFSRLCADWERAARVDPPVRLVIIRSGVVLGRRGGLVGNLFLPFWLGLGGHLGSGQQFLPWIHVDDLISLILFALEEDNVCGVLNGVAPQVITNAQFTKAFARALWRPAALPLPARALQLLLGAERADLLTAGQRVLPTRVLDYGFKYNFPNIDDACRDFAHLLPKRKNP